MKKFKAAVIILGALSVYVSINKLFASNFSSPKDFLILAFTICLLLMTSIAYGLQEEEEEQDKKSVLKVHDQCCEPLL